MHYLHCVHVHLLHVTLNINQSINQCKLALFTKAMKRYNMKHD